MDAAVAELQIDGRMLTSPEVRSVTLHQAGDEWSITFVTDWVGVFASSIRREGVLRNALLQFSTDAGAYSGRAQVRFEGEVVDGFVGIHVTGLGELHAAGTTD